MQYAQRSTPEGIVIYAVDLLWTWGYTWGYAWVYGPLLIYVNSTNVLSNRMQAGDTIWSIIMAVLSDPGHVIIAIISAVVAILIYRVAPTLAVSQGLKVKVELLEREIATMKTREAAMIQYNKDLLARVIAAEQELILLNDISASNSRKMMSMASTGVSNERVMVAIVGSDNSLNEDLTAFRTVESRTGLRYAPLKNATREKIESYLERWRLQRRPVRYAHIAGHMGKDGIIDDSRAITDIIDPKWLSGQIRDMEILVLAGCNSDRIGDLLRSVKTVITIREDVEMHDAAIFTEAFWHEIGVGALPEDAYWAALDRCPTHVREHAEIHL